MSLTCEGRAAAYARSVRRRRTVRNVVSAVLFGLLVLLRILLPLLRGRRDPLSKSLVLEFGVRPSGPSGTWTSRDRVFSGLLSLLTAACCIAVMSLLTLVAKPFESDTTANYVVTGVVVVLWVLALMAIVNGITDLVRAPFTKAPREAAASPQPLPGLAYNLRAALQHPAAFLTLFLILAGLAILIAYLLVR